MGTKSERDLHPAYGDLQIAIALMAGRYADSYADWTLALHTGSPRPALQRQYMRRYQALQRLTAALGRRSHHYQNS